MKTQKIKALSQNGRTPCSVRLEDADLRLGNANWTKGLQARSDWTWGSHKNPGVFPNNLARYFLNIPGTFEQQMNYSTSLIFDKPSYRNGIQVSGFIDRVIRELVISFIAQRRHSWYSMTHHAILGRLTCNDAGMSEQEFETKWSNLLEYKNKPEIYTRLEKAVLCFADKFSTDPKAYRDEDYSELKAAFMEDNEKNYENMEYKQLKITYARQAHALSRKLGISQSVNGTINSPPEKLPNEINKIKVNAQIVELTFICLNFIALATVFTGLNIPDEDFINAELERIVPAKVIQRINELNTQGERNLPELIPPRVNIPLDAIIKGQITLTPSTPKGRRIPLESYEEPSFQDKDHGVTIGGVQVGVWGWGMGAYFPGSLVYMLMHHPELARTEPPYSLPVIFNEDEWRSGVQTAGFVSRLLREIVIQKVYKLNRSRYGIEHHTMFLYREVLNYYGVGPDSNKSLITEDNYKQRYQEALNKAHKIALFTCDHNNSPSDVFSDLELAAMTWVEDLMCRPHSAYKSEAQLRKFLDQSNHRQVKQGIRMLDTSPNGDENFAYQRLLDQQISELSLLVGHMDGLGRAMTILQLEAEKSVNFTSNAQLVSKRPCLHDVLNSLGVSEAVFTSHELLLNPLLNRKVKKDIKAGREIRFNENKNLDENSEF